MKSWLLCLGLYCTAVLGFAQAAPRNFVETCQSAERPTGFDLLVRDHLETPDYAVQLGEPDACGRHWEKLKDRGSLVFTIQDQLKLLPLFPALNGFHLELEQEVHGPALQPSDAYTSFTLRGKLRVADLGWLKAYPNLSTLTFSGRDKDSWIDVTDLGELRHLKVLTLHRLRVRHAKGLEKATALLVLGAQEVTWDEAIDWSALPHLANKTLK